MKKFFVFMLFVGFVNAQSSDKLEKKFDQLNNQYDKESLTKQKILDILKDRFDVEIEE